MPKFNLEDYEPVEDRIRRFYADHPSACIHTELMSDPNNIGTVVVLAKIYTDNGEILRATGLAFEKAGDGYVNKTSHLENCETSAIGRALANFNYSGSKRPSREEMEKVQRAEKQPDSPAKPAQPTNDLDGMFQTIAANKEKYKPNIGDVMNKALKFRTEGNEDGLREIMKEYGL